MARTKKNSPTLKRPNKKALQNWTFEGFTEADSYKITEETPSNIDATIGRIPNALTRNIAAKREPSLYELLLPDERDALLASDEARQIEREGKPVSLTLFEVQVVKALSAYLSKSFNDSDVKEYVENLNTMDAEGNTAKTLNPVARPVSLLQLSKDIIGDTKEKSLRKVEEAILNLEKTEQAQIFYVNGEKYAILSPLIKLGHKVQKYYYEFRSSKGRKKASTEEPTEEKRILIGAQIIFSSLFLYEATTKYCPIYTQKLFEVWRDNKTDLFAMLLSDLESKWRQYYIAAQKAKKAVEDKYSKSDIKALLRMIGAAQKKALSYETYTATIRSRVSTDYETDRKQRSRFIPDLERAIKSLVEYGIISEGKISPQKDKVTFVYNIKFAQDDIDEALLEAMEE